MADYVFLFLLRIQKQKQYFRHPIESKNVKSLNRYVDYKVFVLILNNQHNFEKYYMYVSEMLFENMIIYTTNQNMLPKYHDEIIVLDHALC